MRIVFMGSPQFPVPTLRALHQEYSVVAVITAPDKPAGRGKQIQETAVKSQALALGIPVLQPTNLKDADFLSELKAFNGDLFIVVAFRMLPAQVFEMPRLGCINLHASLLPAYRGAAPINWAIINGETKTGITTFFIEKEIDTGLILLQTPLSIEENETAGSLHDRMMEEGASLMIQTLNGLSKGSLVGRTQVIAQGEMQKKAPKLFRETGLINWQQSAHDIHNLIRGLNPFPGAYSFVSGLSSGDSLKIWSSKLTNHPAPGAAGIVGFADGKRMIVATGNGAIELLEVQASGKKRVSAADFIRGLQSKADLRFVNSNQKLNF